jgi:hypothetical protein
MALYGSEKRQALPQELPSIINGLMQESEAISVTGNRGNWKAGFTGFKASRRASELKKCAVSITYG